MSDHLPECYITTAPDDEEVGCICDRLRACEQRVTDQVNREWAEISVDDEVRIWDEALDAAREAVAAAPVAIREPGVFLLNRGVALAAIDALRKGAQ